MSETKTIDVPLGLAERLHDLAIEAANTYANHPEWRNAARDEQAALADAQAWRDLIDAAQGGQ